MGKYGLLGMIDDRTALAIASSPPEARRSQAGLQRVRYELASVDLVAGTERILPGAMETVYFGQEYAAYPGRYLAIPVPFEPLADYGIGNGILVVGHTAAFELAAYSPRGESLWHVSIAATRTRATSSHNDWARRTLEEWSSIPLVRSTVRSARGTMLYGEYLPAFGRRAWERKRRVSYPGVVSILVDGDRNVWVLRYDHLETASRSWFVFSHDGRWIGAVKLPARFEPFSIGTDYMLGWREEQDGAIIVAMYAIEK